MPMPMPCRNPLLSLLLLLPLSMIPSYASPSPSIPASPVNSTSCAPYRCGNVSISYPFYLSEAPTIPPQYCGFPGMGVFCDNGRTPILLTQSGNYTITNIDYGNRTVFLADTDVYNARNSSCLRVQHNLTFFSNSWLEYTPSDAYLAFFFNCSPTILNAEPIGCLSGNQYKAFVFPTNASELEYGPDWAHTCLEIVVAPVLDKDPITVSNLMNGYGELLKSGFQLTWPEQGSDDCKSCEQSGGRCGFNQTSTTYWVPSCYCSDGLHPHVCGKGKSKMGVIIGVAVGAAVFLLGFVCIALYIQKKRQGFNGMHKIEGDFIFESGKKKFFGKQSLANNLLENEERASDLLLFDFFRITNVTNNFSAENKLGQGGFGPVYKGQLPDGQEIAVKRLARNSGQGLVEFKNEILVIAKLQHINLVKLLGYSIQGEEKILIYEFMPNKSLDFFLFDQTRGALLDWPMRFHIIEGVAQGLLYLHKHSRLKIIHRDLKASNILLDGYMNPKISDFGLARIFCTNEDQGNFTNKVAGTFGYISPEYAADGHFSIKSDVFSFGVLLLEIVSGKRNAGLNQYDDFLNLLGYAWEVWKKGRWLELVDPSLGDGYSMDQVMKCIHVALLCVQEKPGDRPAMWTVTTMLSSESTTALPVPKQPGFFNLRRRDEGDGSSEINETCSLNRITVTDPSVR
ncbi:cysteine-rich receptor-like protein kinase 19 isoform X2 [Typha latifolia]|uniref:cysteine-rich receptor-like protein kinase 19 isoform X2 n=1 Tax=Typha latifolia TaxID=4733 RepID=UPI003C2BD7A7